MGVFLPPIPDTFYSNINHSILLQTGKWDNSGIDQRVSFPFQFQGVGSDVPLGATFICHAMLIVWGSNSSGNTIIAKLWCCTANFKTELLGFLVLGPMFVEVHSSIGLTEQCTPAWIPWPRNGSVAIGWDCWQLTATQRSLKAAAGLAAITVMYLIL